VEFEINNSDQVDQGPYAVKIRKQLHNRPSDKRMISNYQVLNETKNAGLKPPEALFETFMKEADLLGTYKRYCKEYYEDINILCSKFEGAFANNDIEKMVDLYDDLESLKLQHRRKITDPFQL
jgi:XXXCH domain-containing protein